MKYFSYIFLLSLVFSCANEQEDIIKLSSATADASYENFGPELLLDTIPQTFWNSGSRGQHWVNFNFKNSVEVSKVIFEVNVGETVSPMDYTIQAKETGKEVYVNLKSENVTAAKNTDKYSAETELKNISDIRIILSNDSTWVSIRDVKIIGSN